MRYFLAIAVLLCGAASAYTAKPAWCVKWANDSVTLVKAPGKTYNLKRVRTDQVDTEEGEVWTTPDGRILVNLAEGDAYFPGTDKPIADCP